MLIAYFIKENDKENVCDAIIFNVEQNGILDADTITKAIAINYLNLYKISN